MNNISTKETQLILDGLQILISKLEHDKNVASKLPEDIRKHTRKLKSAGLDQGDIDQLIKEIKTSVGPVFDIDDKILEIEVLRGKVAQAKLEQSHEEAISKSNLPEALKA